MSQFHILPLLTINAGGFSFLFMRTWSAKPREVPRQWWVVDAENQILGRLASKIANTLRGKNKPQFTPHVDTGDFVIVLNCAKIQLTGRKKKDKIYYRPSKFVGSLKKTTAEKMLAKQPERLFKKAVQGMLPKNRLSQKLMKKLKVYKGPEHPHTRQRPQAMEIQNGNF